MATSSCSSRCSGDNLVLTDELLKISAFLASFSGLYFTVVLVTDATYREEFFDEILAELRQSFAVRAVYLRARRRRDAVTTAAFIGHGSPMNALEHNRYTEAWRALRALDRRGRGPILVVSAHWYINATAVTAMASPRTIHDFYGFPDELFAFEYPAPGAPERRARRSPTSCSPTWVGLDHDSWGIDHGTWSVLGARVPRRRRPGRAARRSTRTKPFEYHLELGARLAAAARAGRARRRQRQRRPQPRPHRLGPPDDGFDWAQRFDDAARELHDDRPGDGRPARRAPRLRCAPCRRPTTSSRCSTSPAWPPLRASTAQPCSSTGTRWARCR